MKVICLLICLLVFQVHADQAAQKQSRLAMGFYYPSLNAMSSRTDIEVSLTYWQKEITNKAGLYNAYSVLYDDITDLEADFRNGKLDMVTAPPLLLVMYFDTGLFNDGFVGVKEKNKMEPLAIIARKEIVTSPNGYEGKRLLLPQKDLLAEIFFDCEVIKQYRRPFKKVFRQVRKGKNNQRIILDLFFGKADVAVIYKSALDVMVELNPQIAKKIKVIKTFPIKARNYSYFHRDYQNQAKIHEEAKTFSSNPRGQQILEVFKSSDIDVSYVDDLKVIDDFYHAYLELKRTQMHD